MTLGLRCYSPACHRHPASLLVRVPAAKSSLPVLSACALRPRPNLPLRLASSPPSSSFHPDSSQHLPSTRVRARQRRFPARARRFVQEPVNYKRGGRDGASAARASPACQDSFLLRGPALRVP